MALVGEGVTEAVARRPRRAPAGGLLVLEVATGRRRTCGPAGGAGLRRDRGSRPTSPGVSGSSRGGGELGVEAAVQAIRAGRLVVAAHRHGVRPGCEPGPRGAGPPALPARRAATCEQPTALVASDLATLVERVPELRGRAGGSRARCCPGRTRSCWPNPARRYRVAERAEPGGDRRACARAARGWARELLARVGASPRRARTCTAGPTRARSTRCPTRFARRRRALLDGGELPGTPSTVLDFSGPEPRVLREGAAPAAEALERVAAVV